MRRFGKRVRELRRARGLTQDQVALRAGISKGYLSGIENGKVNAPAPRAIRRLAKALGTDVKALLLLAAAEKAPKEIRQELERVALDAEA